MLGLLGTLASSGSQAGRGPACGVGSSALHQLLPRCLKQFGNGLETASSHKDGVQPLRMQRGTECSRQREDGASKKGFGLAEEEHLGYAPSQPCLSSGMLIPCHMTMHGNRGVE